jgi:hypothetical protein
MSDAKEMENTMTLGYLRDLRRGVLTKSSKNRKMRHPGEYPGVWPKYPGYTWEKKMTIKSSKNVGSGESKTGF